MSILIPYVFVQYGFIENTKSYKLNKLFIYLSRILCVLTIIYWFAMTLITMGYSDFKKEIKLWVHVHNLSSFIRYSVSLMLIIILSTKHQNILNIESVITNNLTIEYSIKMRKVNIFNSIISLLVELFMTIIFFFQFPIDNPFSYTFHFHIFGKEITIILGLIAELFYIIFIVGIMINVVILYINFYLGAHYLR